jgi:hypothetical protein
MLAVYLAAQHLLRLLVLSPVLMHTDRGEQRE